MTETFERRIFWLAGIFAAGYLINLLSPVLTPFIAAALLAYVADPLADRFERYGLPRAVAVMLVFLLTLLALAAMVLLIVPLARAQGSALLEVLPRYIRFVETNWLPFISNYLPGGDDETVGLSSFIEQYGSMAGEWGGRIFSTLTRSGGALLAALVSLFLIPVLTFYLLRDWDDIMQRIHSLLPASRRDTIVYLARESDSVLGAFLRGQLLVMLGLATAYTAGLSIIGLPYALAIGVLAGLVSFVPYLGFVFGIVLAGLTALNEPNGLLMLLGVVAVFSVGQMIEGSILTPKLVGDRIGLHPVIVIFAVMAFGQLFGFFGILLALPAAAVLSVIVRFLYGIYVPAVAPPPDSATPTEMSGTAKSDPTPKPAAKLQPTINEESSAASPAKPSANDSDSNSS